jgi:4-hydroxy-tetrahydrodipicolinate synthase
MGNSLSIGGLIPPVATPLTEDDRVDEVAFRAVIRRCLDGGANAIFAGGTAGSGPLLIDSEWHRVMEIARDEVGKDVPLLGGIIVPSTARALERIRFIDDLGYDAIVVTPTYYVTPQRDAEFLGHFGACREATDLEMIVYNIPGCTGCEIPLPLILDMLEWGWTRAVKESSGNRSYFEALLRDGLPRGLNLYQGDEGGIAWALKAGAHGIVPVCANVEPTTYSAAWQAAQQGDWVTLGQMQERIEALRKVIVFGDHNWLAGVLCAMEMIGIGEGYAPRPLRGLGDESRKAIAAILETVSLVTK